jgi:two-component system chemotaxis response regulator CheY
MVQQHGHEVVGEARNGKEALQLYEELRPDLVTMDLTMPEMDGLSALKELKRIDPDAKVIMCSAVGQNRMILEAINAGALDYIVKPFMEEHVIQSIHKCLGEVK